MALTYQAAYRIGRRGGTTRTCGGLQALVRIAADLAFSLTFGVLDLAFLVAGLALRLSWRLVRLVSIALRGLILALGRFLRVVITLPRGFALRSRRTRVGKPILASFDEF